MTKKNNLKIYLAVFALSMVSSSLYLLPYVKYVFYDALLVGLNATNEQLGQLLSMYAIICTIGYIPGGWIADRFSAKKIIIISALVTGSLNLILAFVMNFTMALIIWGMLGLSTSFAYWGASIKAIRMLGDDSEQGKLYGFFQSFEGLMNTFSAFVAMGIFTYFTSQVAGLKFTLIFYGIMCIISAIVLHFTYEEYVQDNGDNSDKIEIKDIGKVLKLPQTWMFAFIIFSIYGVYSGSTMLTPYVTDVVGISVGAAGIIAIFRTYIARFLFCPVGGFISDKTGKTAKTIMIFAILTAAIIAGFFFVSGSTPTIIVLILITTSAAAIYMNYGIMWALAEEVKIPRHLYGTAVGVASILGFLPDSFMHTMFGKWLDDYGVQGYNYIFAFLIGLCAVSVIVALWVIYKKKHIKVSA